MTAQKGLLALWEKRKKIFKLFKYKLSNCYQLACASREKVGAKHLVPGLTLHPVWIVVSIRVVCVFPFSAGEQILAAFLSIRKGGPSPGTPYHLPSGADGGMILS